MPGSARGLLERRACPGRTEGGDQFSVWIEYLSDSGRTNLCSVWVYSPGMSNLRVTREFAGTVKAKRSEADSEVVSAKVTPNTLSWCFRCLRDAGRRVEDHTAEHKHGQRLKSSDDPTGLAVADRYLGDPRADEPLRTSLCGLRIRQKPYENH